MMNIDELHNRLQDTRNRLDKEFEPFVEAISAEMEKGIDAPCLAAAVSMIIVEMLVPLYMAAEDEGLPASIYVAAITRDLKEVLREAKESEAEDPPSSTKVH